MIHTEAWYREAGLEEQFQRLVEEFKRTENLDLLDKLWSLENRSRLLEQNDAIRDLETQFVMRKVKAALPKWKVGLSRGADFRLDYSTRRHMVNVHFDTWFDADRKPVLYCKSAAGMVQTSDGYMTMNHRVLPLSRKEYSLEAVVSQLRAFEKRFPQDGSQVVPVRRLSVASSETYVHLPDYWQADRLEEVMEDVLSMGDPVVRVLRRDGELYAMEGSHRLAAVYYLHQYKRRLENGQQVPLPEHLVDLLEEYGDPLPRARLVEVSPSDRIEDHDLVGVIGPITAQQFWEHVYGDESHQSPQLRVPTSS